MTPRSVRYHPDFGSDVVGAATWYDDRQINLGDAFIAAVRETVELIIEDPERRGSQEYGIRYWRTKRFPYVVFYDVNKEELLIVGVMHTSQDSQKWLKRRG